MKIFLSVCTPNNFFCLLKMKQIYADSAVQIHIWRTCSSVICFPSFFSPSPLSLHSENSRPAVLRRWCEYKRCPTDSVNQFFFQYARSVLINKRLQWIFTISHQRQNDLLCLLGYMNVHVRHEPLTHFVRMPVKTEPIHGSTTKSNVFFVYVLVLGT